MIVQCWVKECEVMKNEYKVILNKMDWNNSEEIQLEGRREASKVTDLKWLMQPVEYELGKGVWDNCAMVLSEKNDDKLVGYLDDLLEWLQDLNWPGSLTILNRLLVFDEEILKPRLEEIIDIAYKDDDIDWLYNLSFLLKNDKLKSKINKNYLEILRKNNERL